MNERIVDLMEQAFDHCKKYDDEGKTGLVKTTEAFHTFAELIVKECIDTVLDSSVEYTTRPQIAEELKEHFGVE